MSRIKQYSSWIVVHYTFFWNVAKPVLRTDENKNGPFIIGKNYKIILKRYSCLIQKRRDVKAATKTASGIGKNVTEAEIIFDDFNLETDESWEQRRMMEVKEEEENNDWKNVGIMNTAWLLREGRLWKEKLMSGKYEWRIAEERSEFREGAGTSVGI